MLIVIGILAFLMGYPLIGFLLFGFLLAYNRKRNAKALEEARARTAALNGEPPGYTFAHHDKLVRLVGAKRTRELERAFLGKRPVMTFAEALALAQRAA